MYPGRRREELLRPSAAGRQATTESVMGVRSTPEDGRPADGHLLPPLQPSARLRPSPIPRLAAFQIGTAPSELRRDGLEPDRRQGAAGGWSWPADLAVRESLPVI